MRRRWRKITAILVLTSHLLAITVANAFHQHGGRACSGEVSAHDAHSACVHRCGCPHDHASAGRESPAKAQADWGQSCEDCQVCQFLAQKWMPVDLTDAPRQTGAVCQVPFDRPLRLKPPLLPPWESRGPPVVA